MPYPSVILPGYFAAAAEYFPLQTEMESKGFPTRIVPLQARDWWVTVGGRPMSPILAALQTTIAQTLEEFACDKVNVIGHSAGGWIARIYLGSVPYYQRVWAGRSQVATLVTLGTPHISREPWTRKNLDFVQDHYPGAFWPEISYICVAGQGILGQPFQWQRWDPAAWFAYTSYELTAGKGDVWGDGITPITAAHLAGATNLTLPKVMHSPRGNRYWYGSASVVQEWLSYLQ